MAKGSTRSNAGRKPLKTADGAKAVHKAIRCSPWEFERLKTYLTELRTKGQNKMNTNNTITIHTQLREPIVFPGYKPCITVGQLLRRLHGSDVSLADMKWEDGCGDGVGVFLWINSQYEFHGMVASWDGVELCISKLEAQMASN